MLNEIYIFEKKLKPRIQRTVQIRLVCSFDSFIVEICPVCWPQSNTRTVCRLPMENESFSIWIRCRTNFSPRVHSLAAIVEMIV
jgi:hypothetical protein